MGCFQYSHEEDTIAYDVADDIDADMKADRAATLMEIQQAISYEKNQAKIGNTYKVLFDRKEGKYFIGRSEFDSPEVDNEVKVLAKNSYVRIGDFAQVKITAASEYDLTGSVVI
jgi:ribosomal protein S12 methylthiotransferase